MSDYRWLNDISQQFLNRTYLLPGQTVDERVDIICNRAEEVLGKEGFAEKFKSYFKKGWYSFSTPVWTNYGTDRGLNISCFGSSISDSMESILGTASEVGMMTKHGGGTSAYFGNLRGRGASIKNNGESSGAVHFMKLFETNMSIVSQGNCYREGTEVLTNNGFKDFRDVLKTDKLAQLDEYNNIDFTSDYELVVNEFDGKLKSINGLKKENSFSLDITPNHRMVISKLKTKNGKKNWPKYTEIVEAKDLNLHRDNRLPVAGKIKSGKGLSFEDRLLIAYQADGIKDGVNRKIRFHFSKKRKIERLKWICNNLNIDYDICIQKDKTIEIKLPVLSWVRKENFRDWINLEDLSFEWCSEFLEELKYWDGSLSGSSKNGITYCSGNKDNIDLVQAMASMCNKRTRISTRYPKDNRKFLYRINITNIPYRGGDSLSIKDVKYKGKVYCAIVPKGRLLVRYDDKVCVCGNTRRGSFAAYLPIDHPDTTEFLTIRTDGSPIQNLSFGIVIPDYWMKEMINGDKAKRKLWLRVLESRANTGYPYILFKDTVNNNTVDVYKDKNMTINASNLCSEILLPTSEEESFVCCLSSMNLLYYDEWKDTDAVETMVYFLDTVLTEFIRRAKDIKYMERAVRFSERHRAIGLGVFGWHSYLQENMIPFESMRAKMANVKIIKDIKEKAYAASEKMAKEYGEPELLKGYGRRHATLMAVAPTKSSSAIIGQASEGIEPHTANYYIKDLQNLKFSMKNPQLEKLLKSKNKNTSEVWNSILEKGGSVQHLDILTKEEKDVFKTFSEISQKEVLIQAAQRQKYIDQGQSLNLMIHPSIPVKDINKLMIEAWIMGIKTLYYQKSVNAAQQFSRNILHCESCE